MKNLQIEKRENELKSKDKNDLKIIYKRSSQICDLTGVSKGCLISMILINEFGEKRCAEHFNWKN